MAFDDAKFNAIAKNGDVAGVAVAAALAAGAAERCIIKLSGIHGVELDDDLKQLRKANSDLLKRFDELTGWTSDDNR